MRPAAGERSAVNSLDTGDAFGGCLPGCQPGCQQTRIGIIFEPGGLPAAHNAKDVHADDRERHADRHRIHGWAGVQLGPQAAIPFPPHRISDPAGTLSGTLTLAELPSIVAQSVP